MKVKLYYGDIKYTTVSQSRAYDVITLLGECLPVSTISLLTCTLFYTLLNQINIVSINAANHLVASRKLQANSLLMCFFQCQFHCNALLKFRITLCTEVGAHYPS